MLIFIAAAAVLSPLTSPSTWISTDDYPPEALRNGIEGVVGVELNIGHDGKPIACAAVIPSADATLNSASCALLMLRARFSSLPADVETAKYNQKISWKIPRSDLISTIQSGSVSTVSILPGGQVGSCKTQMYGDKLLGEAEFCDVSRNVGMLEYFAGAPLNDLQTIYIRTVVKPQREEEIAINGVSASAVQHLIFEASFSVDKSGKIQNCKIVSIDQIFKDKNVCQEFASSGPDFDADPTLKVPKNMSLLLDVWSEKRP